MKLEKEDYIDPACPLCGKPGETESAKPVPADRIQRIAERATADGFKHP